MTVTGSIQLDLLFFIAELKRAELAAAAGNKKVAAAVTGRRVKKVAPKKPTPKKGRAR